MLNRVHQDPFLDFFSLIDTFYQLTTSILPSQGQLIITFKLKPEYKEYKFKNAKFLIGQKYGQKMGTDGPTLAPHAQIHPHTFFRP